MHTDENFFKKITKLSHPTKLPCDVHIFKISHLVSTYIFPKFTLYMELPISWIFKNSVLDKVSSSSSSFPQHLCQRGWVIFFGKYHKRWYMLRMLIHYSTSFKLVVRTREQIRFKFKSDVKSVWRGQCGAVYFLPHQIRT